MKRLNKEHFLNKKSKNNNGIKFSSQKSRFGNAHPNKTGAGENEGLILQLAFSLMKLHRHVLDLNRSMTRSRSRGHLSGLASG